MGLNYGYEIYDINKICEEFNLEDKDKYINQILPKFGDVIDSKILVVASIETWEDYDPSSELLKFLRRTSNIPEGATPCSMLQRARIRERSHGANHMDVADEFGMPLIGRKCAREGVEDD